MSQLDCRPSSDAKLTGPTDPEPIEAQDALPQNWLANGAAVISADGRLLAANHALAEWLGLPDAGLPGLRLAELMGRRCPEWQKEFEQLLQSTAPSERVEFSTSQPSRERLCVEVLRHDAECYLQLESVVPSLAELEDFFPEDSWGRMLRHHLFQRMLRSEAQVNNLMQCWPGIIFSQRPDASFIFVSPKIEQLTGIPAVEWQRCASCFWAVVHEADANSAAGRLQSTREPAGASSTFRVRHLRTGRVSYIWEYRHPVRTQNGLLLCWEGIWLDITRQTIAEQRLLNLSWRENLGTLTMGLAHDFCNLMSGIAGLSETFQASSSEDSPMRSGLAMIHNTAIQASKLAHRLRRLHQGLPGEKSYQGLNEFITTLVELLQKVLPRNVRLQTQFEPGQHPIYTDPVELQQVIVNLALNAADAMPQGGQLTFQIASHAQRPDSSLKLVSSLLGNMPRTPLLRLSVQDTGTGIPERFLKSIFDPFFTTKPLGKGSGLGLYNTKLFAEKHGAAVSVETSPGAGTTFHLWFAQADFTEARQLENPQRPARHTLLAVGTAGPVLDRLVEMLRQHTYYVLPATNEAEAVEALHAPHFQFTGIILVCEGWQPDDLVLCNRVCSYQPPLRTILLLSGCNQDEIEPNAVPATDAVLPLDLPAQEFLLRLRTALEK
jgi:signal transduction histidine kinase